jgi:hypothetical protein
VADARSRREVIRLLADARRRLAAAEAALDEAHATRKRAEEAYDAASDASTPPRQRSTWPGSTAPAPVASSTRPGLCTSGRVRPRRGSSAGVSELAAQLERTQT